MIQLRTYTIADRESLEYFAAVVWKRHITSLAVYEIYARHVWIDREGLRLVAVVEHPEGVDIADCERRFMAGPEFQADCEGFDLGRIRGVETLFLEIASSDPATAHA